MWASAQAHCVNDVARWFLENNLLLNPTKTEAILFGTDQRLRSINHSTGVDVVGSVVKFTDALKLLGVTLDSSLSFDRHITEVCRSCHFHIRALRHIRPLLTNDAAISVANSIVSSRLDYCNSLLCNTTERNLNKLQRIQNTLARVTCQSPRSSSASSLRKSLHWLPVRQRVIYKTALITYKALQTGQPVYLRDLLHYHQPARTLSSSSQLLLYHPTSTRTNFQSKGQGFHYHHHIQGTSENRTVHCCIVHTTQSNISSATGASDSNSRHTAPPINVFDI